MILDRMRREIVIDERGFEEVDAFPNRPDPQSHVWRGQYARRDMKVTQLNIVYKEWEETLIRSKRV